MNYFNSCPHLQGTNGVWDILFVAPCLENKSLLIDDLDRAGPQQQDRLISFMNRHDSNPFFATASDPQSLQLPLRQRFYHLTIRPYEVTALDNFVRENCRELGISIGEDGAVEQLVKTTRCNPRVLLIALEYIHAMKNDFTRAAVSSNDFQRRLALLTGMSSNP